MNAPNHSESTAIAVAARNYDLSPRDFEEAWRMADYLANSDMVPKDFKGRPGNCLVAIQWGAELGLKTMQAIQNIAVINGRPSLWGDVMLALVRASPLCEYVVESVDGDRAVCRVKRRSEPEQVREFTKDDAVKAALWGKQGPWQQYPKRMLQMRARAWALRDVFTDVLKGLHMAEEVIDLPPEKHMGAAEVVAAPKPATYDPEAFKKNLPAWRKAIETRKKTAEDVIATIETKAPLTDAQKAEIRAITPAVEAATGANEPQDVTPKVTFASVADRLNKAQDMDQLADAGIVIGEVADEQQRRELNALYQARHNELAGKE
jgi:hypothetical protein